MTQRKENAEANHYPDPIDRAAMDTSIQTEDAIEAQRAKSRQTLKRWAPRPDGCCACGCGEDVDPRRIAMGYGLTIDCAAALERR